MRARRQRRDGPSLDTAPSCLLSRCARPTKRLFRASSVALVGLYSTTSFWPRSGPAPIPGPPGRVRWANQALWPTRPILWRLTSHRPRRLHRLRLPLLRRLGYRRLRRPHNRWTSHPSSPASRSPLSSRFSPRHLDHDLVPRRSDRLAAKSAYRDPVPEKQARRVLPGKWTNRSTNTATRTPRTTPSPPDSTKPSLTPCRLPSGRPCGSSSLRLVSVGAGRRHRPSERSRLTYIKAFPTV